jgi:glycogen synthase kinase 3 beta
MVSGFIADKRIDYTDHISLEMSIAPHLNHKLVPVHMRQALLNRGIDIDNFTPMSKQEMMARLD